MASGAKLQGIFTPNIVPLDARGEINEDELRRYTDWLIEGGVHGLYPNGSTGEFTRFTTEERRRIIAIMVDQTRGRVPILAGAAEANTRETLRACEYYGSLGVRAVAIVSPFYYKLSPSGVYKYFKEIGRNTPVDVTLYNIPLFASPIDVPTIARLAEECPRIVAIKDSSGDLPNMMRMIEAVRPNRPDFTFLTGWDPMLLPMVLAGADGGTLATSGVVPQSTRRLFDLARSGQIAAAVKLQYQILHLFDAMVYSADFPAGVWPALQLLGFDTGISRQPVGEDQQRKLAEMRPQLAKLLAEHGAAPSAKATTRAAESVDVDQVSRIVRSVMDELSSRGMA